jgi:RNA-directed DNA polymerase
VNTSAPQTRVLEMQTKLHQWAGENEDRRFDDLYNLVYDPAFLLVGWQRVKGNKGARTAGVDGITVEHVEREIGEEQFLADLREDLRSQRFHPLPVRQRMIPKANGKLRQLGIPTVRDRVAQAALKLVLEPIFEADFQPCSYGFRPNRRAQDAIEEVVHLGNSTYELVLEADAEACFDNIDHVALMERVRRRIKDKKILALVKAFLKAGILTELGQEQETYTGTPQGGILSPLLANIALSVLDDHFAKTWREEMNTYYQRMKRRRNGLGNWRLIRYADDWVVMVSGSRANAEALKEEVRAVLAPIGLRLAEAKTKVVHLDEGFDFLGFRIQRRTRRGTGQRVIHTQPSKKARQAIKEKVRQLTSRTSRHTSETLLGSLNRTLRGWCNHFKHGVVKRIFQELDWFTQRRVTKRIRVGHKRHHPISWTEFKRRFMRRNGRRWDITAGSNTLFRPAYVPVTRYRYRGSRIPTPWTPQILQPQPNG